MSADLLAILLRASLVASAAIILVLCLRQPLRHAFGAQEAYSFWLLVPFATLAAFLPARSVVISPDAAGPATDAGQRLVDAGPFALAPMQWALDAASLLLAIWAMGALVSAAILLAGHRRLLADLRAGNASVGPAVIGVISPRVLLPADFERRYTEAERRLVLEHEREHIKAGDLRVNGLAALVQCANWFNPLVYVARGALRIDQELACDERVMRRHSNVRSVYAQAMLKAQLAQHPGFGCAWPPFGESAMRQRIIMLGRNPAGIGQRRFAGALLVSTVLAAATTAWASQPPRETLAPAAEQSLPAETPAAGAAQSAVAEALDNAAAPLNLTPAPSPAAVEPAAPPTEAVLPTTVASIETVAIPSPETKADTREIDAASATEPQDVDDFDAARTKRGILRMLGQVPGRGQARADRAAGQKAERERQRTAGN